MSVVKRRQFLIALGAGVALPLLGACAAPPAPSPTAAPAKPAAAPAAAPKAAPTAAPKPTVAAKPSPAAQPTAAPVQRQIVKWKHATTGPSYLWVPQRMALEKDFYKEEGIDLEFVTLNNDVTIMKGIVAGEVDGGDLGSSYMLVTRSQGGAVKILGSWLNKLSYDLLTKKEINSVKDLEGKNVAITAVGGLPHVMMLALFEKHGVDPSKVNFVTTSTPNDTHIQALVAGTVDSGLASAELRWAIADQPQIKVLTSIAEEIPQYVRVTFDVTDKTYDERKDVIERVIRAYSRGVQHAMTNKQDAVAFGVKMLNQPADRIGQAWDLFTQHKWTNATGIVPLSSYEWMQDLNLRLKIQETPVKIADVVDDSIAKKVAKDLGLSA